MCFTFQCLKNSMRLWRISKYFCTKLTKTALSLMQSILSCRAAARFGSTKASSCIYFVFLFYLNCFLGPLSEQLLFRQTSVVFKPIQHITQLLSLRSLSENLGIFQGTKIQRKPKISFFKMVTGFNPQAQKLEQRSLYRIVKSTTWKKALNS